MIFFKRAIPPLTAGLIIALALAWAFTGLQPVLQARERQDGWNHHPGALMPGQTAGQTFICREAGLTRIDVRLGTYGHPLPARLDLHLVQVADNLPKPVARPIADGDGGIQVELEPGGQLGQTFIPKRPGLNGVWLLVDTRRMPPESEVVVSLYRAGRFNFINQRLVQARVAAVDMPRLGFARVPLDLPLARVGELTGQRLLMTIHTTGTTPKKGLRLRFVSDNWNYKQVVRASVEESSWIPARPYASQGVWRQPWEYWLGDLIFKPAYPATVADGPVIRTVRLSGAAMSDNGFNSFSFQPVAGSKGSRYYFYLTTPGPGPGPTTLADTKGRYPYGRLVLDGVPTRGSLAFRAWTITDRRAAAEKMIAMVGLNKPGRFNRPWLLPALTIAVIVLTGLLLGCLLMGERKED